jgi:hypothetical protein
VESAAGPPGVGHAEGRIVSSAILYVAIVAIWAGVLIPRWLRRDSSSSSSGGRADGEIATPEPVTTEPEAPSEEPVPRSRHRDEPVPAARPVTRSQARGLAHPAGRPEARGAGRSEAREAGRSEAREAGRSEAREAGRSEAREAGRSEARPAGRREVPRGGPRDDEHKRVLSARRRLFGMLLALVIGSGALAVTKMAAWWVVVPPSFMLLGYMALLREAAKADAERRELARTRTRTAAAPADRHAGTGRPAVPARPAAAPVTGPPPVPDAEVIAISASLTSAGEEFYDQYADAKLRAVGDLAPALTG